MVIGVQNEILVGIKKLPFNVSFQIFNSKETQICNFMLTIRISSCISMTISSLIFHGTGCNKEGSQEAKIPHRDLNK